MSANKLPFGLILQEATVIPLLLIHRLLLLGHVFVVGHNNSVKLAFILCNAPIPVQNYKKIPHKQVFVGFFGLDGMI